MKNDLKYLLHIMESIVLIDRFLEGFSKTEFNNNVEKQFAVVRGLEIIGEAVKNLSSSFRKKYPQITWRDIAGTRDILIHAYFSVDVGLVWDIVKKDLPSLKEKIKEIIQKEN